MAIEHPNFHHLQHFWVVAQEGSLLGASRKLGMRHSTLSAQLRALESALGAPLFLRRSRGVSLTAHGETVRGYCDQIFRLGSELLEVTLQKRTVSLRVGMLPSVPRSLLYAALQNGFDKVGSMRIELSMTTVAAAPVVLLSGQLDVVIADRLVPPVISTPIYSHLVGSSGIGLYAIPSLAQRYRQEFPSSLDGAPLLLPTSGPLAEGLMTWFAEGGVHPRIVAEFDDVPTMKGFAARGHGILPIRQALAMEARQRYGLVQVGAIPGLVDYVYALTACRQARHPNVQRLIEHCRQKLSSQTCNGSLRTVNESSRAAEAKGNV
jgi:LysR family transcriptional activator of nhaA